MPDSFETLLYDKRDGVALVTLNRPAAGNAINRRMVDEIDSVWEDVRADGGIHVAIMTGAGRAFCVGSDLKDAAHDQALDHFSSFRPYRYSWNTPLSPKAHDLFKPVIVAVNGLCGPGGLEFVSEAEIAICSDDATFTDAHVSAGVIVHSAVAVAKRIPYNHVARMALLGAHERIDARRAYEIGLVTEVVPGEKLLDRAMELAGIIMRNSPAAVQASVEVLWHSLSLGLRDAMQLANYMQRLYARHPDFTEGARAFAEKRPANWQRPEPDER
jgi:enoyl-CoA hydratase/carnithine racemase